MENSIRVLTNDARFYKRQVIPSLIFGFFLFGVGVLYPSIVFIGFGIAGFVNFFLMRRKSRTTLEKAKRLKAKHRELQEQKNLF